jgi:formylglycine-generating enzyme required for sulfatase activity
MGIYEVTQKQYQDVMGENPSSFRAGGFSAYYVTGLDTDDFPVEMVTWYDAVEFCNKLSEEEGLTPAYIIIDRAPSTGYPITGIRSGIAVTTVTCNWDANGYRLPTEAQWEYACRAGTKTAFSTGDTISDDTGWYRGNSDSRTHRVGGKLVNPWGLYDMHGNVNEWCWDWYGIYATGAQNDPTGASGDTKVVRGGSWLYNGLTLRSAFRDEKSPGERASSIGIRLVRLSE